MTDIHIPPESVDAAALALAEADDGIVDYKTLATATIRAALENWPGMGRFEDETGWDVHIELPLLVPLPVTEPRE